MIRIWLRQWLGITIIETRRVLNDGDFVDLKLAKERADMALSRIGELERAHNFSPYETNQALNIRVSKLEMAVTALQQAPEIDLPAVQEAIIQEISGLKQDISEFRERLDMPAKRKPSGRPFSVLQKVAAMGAEAQRMKDAG